MTLLSIPMLDLSNPSGFLRLRTPLEGIRSWPRIPVERDFLSEQSTLPFGFLVGGNEPIRRDETEGRRDLVEGSSSFGIAEKREGEGVVVGTSDGSGEEGTELGEGIDGVADGRKEG